VDAPSNGFIYPNFGSCRKKSPIHNPQPQQQHKLFFISLLQVVKVIHNTHTESILKKEAGKATGLFIRQLFTRQGNNNLLFRLIGP